MRLIFCMHISMKSCYKLIEWFWWWWSIIPKVPKTTSLQCLYNTSKKKLKMKLIFSMQVNVISSVSWKFILTLWASKFLTRLILSLLMEMINYSQITKSNKFAISLQYLKRVRNGGHFWHPDKCQSFYKLVLSFLMEVARHLQNTQNRKLVIFLQYIKKNCCNCFVFYGDANHSDVLWGSRHDCCYFLTFKIIRTIF